MDYYSAIEKNEAMPLAARWMSPEIVTLTEISQIEKNFPYMQNRKKKRYKRTYLQSRGRLADLENQLMAASREDGGRDSWGVWDGRVHTAIFKMDNQQGPAVWHREFCSMLCGSLDGKRVMGVGGGWIYVDGWLSPFAVHLKLSQHC